MIFISKTIGLANFFAISFLENNGESQIYIDELGTMLFTNIQCIRHNNIAVFETIARACFNFRNTVIRIFNYMVIDNCKGINSAGLILFDNSTILAEVNPMNLTAFVYFNKKHKK